MAHGDRKEKSGKNSVGGEEESGTRNTNKSSSNEIMTGSTVLKILAVTI